MRKNEWVYRELLYQFIEKRNNKFTQSALAKKLGISLSTVNNALKPLANLGAIEVRKMSFSILDVRKFLFYWASTRNIKRDISYATHVDMQVVRIEKRLWKKVKFTAFSGYRFKFRDVASDYIEAYSYADHKTLNWLKREFPKKDGFPNLFVLKADEHMVKYPDRDNVTIPELFVDLWNLRTWEAKEFSKALERKIIDIVGVQTFEQT